MIRKMGFVAVLAILTIGAWSPAGAAVLETREATYYGSYYGAPPLVGVYGSQRCDQASSLQGVCFSGLPSGARSAMIEIDDDFVAPARAFVVTHHSLGMRRGAYLCSGAHFDVTDVVWIEAWVDMDGAQNCAYGGGFYGYATTGVVRLHLSDEPVPVYSGGGGW